MNTENIVEFLQESYTDEKLAQLLCHAESGKLFYNSCCCLVGIPTAPHPLQEMVMPLPIEGCLHLFEARKLPFAEQAESEFHHLASSDSDRRERLIPIIHAEMDRREKAREQSIAAEQVAR